MHGTGILGSGSKIGGGGGCIGTVVVSVIGALGTAGGPNSGVWIRRIATAAAAMPNAAPRAPQRDRVGLMT